LGIAELELEDFALDEETDEELFSFLELLDFTALLEDVGVTLEDDLISTWFEKKILVFVERKNTSSESLSDEELLLSSMISIGFGGSFVSGVFGLSSLQAAATIPKTVANM
jgi:hypothetical protein